MDTIKVRMQTAPRTIPPLYANTLDCTLKLWRAEGIRGLYRGVTVPMTGTTPVFALSFWGYGLGQQLFWNTTRPNAAEANRVMHASRVAEIAAAGSVAGLATVPVLCPLERVKCVMQVQKRTSNAPVAGPWAVLRQLHQIGGVRSVFAGLSAISMREVMASAVYFATYEVVRWNLTPADHAHPSVPVTLFAGGMAGVTNWLVAIPIDTLKSNLQVSLDPKREYPHGIRSVWKEMRAKGLPLSSLFRGLAPALLRAFPANAAAFLGYEQTMKLLSYARTHQPHAHSSDSK